MKRFILSVAFALLTLPLFGTEYEYESGGISIEIPEDWEVATDTNGFVAMPADANLYIILKSYDDVETEEELQEKISATVSSLFSTFEVGEEGTDAVGGIDVTYSFFNATCLGEVVGGMGGILSYEGRTGLLLMFGSDSALQTYGTEIDEAYASLAVIQDPDESE